MANSPTRAGRRRRVALRRLLRPLLAFPLFYKILIANVALAALGAVVGAALVLRAAALQVEWRTIESVPVFLVGWAFFTVLVNAVILTLALAPLHTLERVVGERF